MTNVVGCFGSVLYHDPEGRRCNACPLMQTCGEEVVKNKVKLESLMKALATADRSTSKARKRAIKALSSDSVLVKPVSKVAASSAHKSCDASLAHLNVKVREFVQRWMDKGLDFKTYKSGINPFLLSGNKFASVAMQFLMDRGECTKLEMTDHLIDNAGARGPWGPGTACSHTGIVFEAFEHLGIITVSEGKAHIVR